MDVIKQQLFLFSFLCFVQGKIRKTRIYITVDGCEGEEPYLVIGNMIMDFRICLGYNMCWSYAMWLFRFKLTKFAEVFWT